MNSMTTGYVVQQIRTRFLTFINYVYVVMDKETKETAVIDPSWDLRKIEAAIKALDGRLTSILLTHSHFDHTNLAATLQRKYSAQVFMSGEEIDFSRFQCRTLNRIQAGQVITLGNTRIQSMHTPGHTPGSTVFSLPHHLFTGDTVFIEGCGTCHRKGGNSSQLFQSLSALRRTIDRQVEVFPGHSFGKKPGYAFGHLLRENIYFQIDDETTFNKLRMRKNQQGLFRFR